MNTIPFELLNTIIEYNNEKKNIASINKTFYSYRKKLWIVVKYDNLKYCKTEFN